MQTHPSPNGARSRFFIPPRIVLVTLALGASAFLSSPSAARAAEEVSASAEVDNNGTSYRLFYDKLGDGGDWIQTDRYGYVFQPKVAVSDHAWRPYTDGYWAQTDAGWTWISNEDHGWATYHYGRWANIVDTGWVWVPGEHWSPGFVSWRVSNDHKHVGWAPLPPEAHVARNEVIENWVDTAYDIGPEAYVFIETNHFGENSYRSHLVPIEQNTTIITETTNVTRCSYRTVESQQIIFNGGPDVAIIREGIGRPVRQFRLDARPQQVEYFQREDFRRFNAVNGNTLVVATAAPEVITSTTIRVNQPARIVRRVNTIEVDRGYRGIGDQQAAQRVREAIRAQSPPPPPQIQRQAEAAIRRNGPPPANRPQNPNQAAANNLPPPPNVNPGGPNAGNPPAPNERKPAEAPAPGAQPNPADKPAPGARPEPAGGEPKAERPINPNRPRGPGGAAPADRPNAGQLNHPNHPPGPGAVNPADRPDAPKPKANPPEPKAEDEARPNEKEPRSPGAPHPAGPGARPNIERPEAPGAKPEREEGKPPAPPAARERENPAPGREPAPADGAPQHKPGAPAAPREKPENPAAPHHPAAEEPNGGNKGPGPGEGAAAKHPQRPNAPAEGEKKPQPPGGGGVAAPHHEPAAGAAPKEQHEKREQPEKKGKPDDEKKADQKP